MFNDIWPLTSYSDIQTNQTFPQFHDLDSDFDLHQITSGFHWAFERVWHASRENLHFWTPGSVTLFAYAPIVETNIPELAVSFLNISTRISLATFSILHQTLFFPNFYIVDISDSILLE